MRAGSDARVIETRTHPDSPALPGPTPPGIATDATALDTARALGSGLSALLRTAHGLVAAGRRVDLAGLDRQVGLLCAKALDLPPEFGRRLQPDLAALLHDLDRLAGALDRGGGGPAAR